MSHFDGPLFFPTITTISIGSHTVLEFHKPKDFTEEQSESSNEPEFKLLIEPRSLLILKDDLYHKYMHSISEIETDDPADPLIKFPIVSAAEPLQRSTRYSLTIRNVPKTTKLKLKFGK